MTIAELHEILDDENRTLAIDELKQIIYELKNDTLYEHNRLFSDPKKIEQYRSQFYFGESNAFQLCLDLLEHLKI